MLSYPEDKTFKIIRTMFIVYGILFFIPFLFYLQGIFFEVEAILIICFINPTFIGILISLYGSLKAHNKKAEDTLFAILGAIAYPLFWLLLIIGMTYVDYIQFSTVNYSAVAGFMPVIIPFTCQIILMIFAFIILRNRIPTNESEAQAESKQGLTKGQ